MKFLASFLSILLITSVHAYEVDDYVEPMETEEFYDEVPPAATSFPSQKPYRKKDYNVDSDDSFPVESYDEFAPIDDYQDYGVEATDYDSYDSVDY